MKPKKNPNEKEHALEKRYKMKGVPIEVYITENGEFQCTPAPESCSDKNKTNEFLNVLKAMPQDKAAVWAKRLDRLETIKRCPILQHDTDLHKKFNDFLAGNNPHSNESKIVIHENGGDKANGQE